MAWNAAGHRLIACIAWEHMTVKARAAASELLQAHPEYERWRKRAGRGGDSPERAVFAEASSWADDIRQDKRFYTASREEPTPTLPGFPDMERRLHWHYINRPFDGGPRQAPLSGELDRQLVELSKTLGNPESSDDTRRYALPWLLHLVGDAHQPLHVLTRKGDDGHWDAGGNRLRIINPFNPRHPEMTLHSFWDDLPGVPWLRGEALERDCQALMAAYPRPRRQPSSQKWLDESWQIAHDSAYPPELDDITVIGEDFYERSREIANRRLAEAGYRLADLLNRALNSKER